MLSVAWMSGADVLTSQAAETDPAQSQRAPGPPEQTPEEAAGGFRNMMRIKRACETDAKRLCPDVKPGGGRILQCLRQHDAELAPDCRKAVEPQDKQP